MIGFNEDEIRPCATCGSTTCGHLTNDARVRTSSEIMQVRVQLNPEILPAPTAPATLAAGPRKE